MLRTCLVVDPSQVVRKVARRIFETMQFHTVEAETGREALQKCEADMPDAILLDGHLSTMSSAEVLATLRALPDGRKPLVIYCTTENDASEIARALSAGADDYVLKPFDRESIRAKLTSAGLKS
jgi:two-component system, chemotaxis family, chemotaxis protein CheY